MKKVFAALCALALLAAACTPAVKHESTPAPTSSEVTPSGEATPTPSGEAAPTPSGEAAPTPSGEAVPTPSAKDRPTVPPDFSGASMAFPTPGRLGKLVDGPLFKDPIKYFVISGESDLRYVYDANGELVTCFNAMSGEGSSWSEDGFYGEHGAPFGYSIEKGEFLPDYHFFGDMCLRIGFFWQVENGDGGYYLTEIADATLENKLTFVKEGFFEKEEEYADDEVLPDLTGAYRIGVFGGVLKIDGDFLILLRDYDDRPDDGNSSVIGGTGILLDSNGREKERLDLAKFGMIRGCYGGKYLMCNDRFVEGIEDGMPSTSFDLYSLSGELVMEGVRPFTYEFFCVDDEMIDGWLSLADYLIDSNGNILDKDLKRVDAAPKKRWCGEAGERFGSANVDGLEFEQMWRGIYAGIKDGEGNWLFKIYNPALASDAMNDDY